MTGRYRRVAALICFVCCVLCSTLSVTAAVADQEKRHVIKVGYIDYDGFITEEKDGTYTGYGVEYLRKIAEYTGWEYEFVTGEATELLDEMSRGGYDLMGGMYYLEGYDEIYSYPKYVMGANYSLLMYHRDDDTIKSFDYTTLNGKTIGVFKKAVSKIDRLQKFLNFNHIECELIYYDTSEEYGKCLDHDEVDLRY